MLHVLTFMNSIHSLLTSKLHKLITLTCTLTKMKRLLQGCSSFAATMQQSNMHATTGGDKVVN